MVSVYDVNPNELIKGLAKHFSSNDNFKPPAWAKFVKTGSHKERPPVDPNWWYVRLAAILRTININGPVGVQRIRSKYGGSKKFGLKPKRSVKGSGSIVRKCLQQLEKQSLIEQTKDKKGRRITKAGLSLIDKTAASIKKV